MQISKVFPFAQQFDVVIPSAENLAYHSAIDINPDISISVDPDPFSLDQILLLNDHCDTLQHACQLLFLAMYGYTFHISVEPFISKKMNLTRFHGSVALLLRISDKLNKHAKNDVESYNENPFVMHNPSQIDLLHFVDSIVLDYEFSEKVTVSVSPLFNACDCLYIGIELG